MRIVFMGTPSAAVPTLSRIIDDGHEVVAVYSQPDRPSGRGKHVSFSPVKEFAVARDIPVIQPKAIKAESTIEEFRRHAADVAIVVAYGRILPVAYLEAYPHGAFNVHFSLLPKYRGAAPVNWAIVNGEAITGVTTMKMDAGLDTGDILLQAETQIGTIETAVELMNRLADLGAELLSQTLGRIDQIEPIKQDEEAATYAPIMKKSDGLIDWEQTARSIRDQIRGFQPFPSSYTFLQGKRVTIYGGDVVEQDSSTAAKPGTAFVGEKQLFIICGGGTALRINEIQLEGKRRGSALDFVNGTRLVTGDIFSSPHASEVPLN